MLEWKYPEKEGGKMKPEEIADKLWSKYGGHDYGITWGGFSEAIKEALEMYKASKWKYPDKGELPFGRWVLFYLHNGKFCVGLRNDETSLVDWLESPPKEHFAEEISKWQYAPEVE